MLMSKSKLMPLLIERGFIQDASQISYEAFGRKVFAYIPLKNAATRKELEKFLAGIGVQAKTDYWPGSATAEVPVSYFKGVAWHHDE